MTEQVTEFKKYFEEHRDEEKVSIEAAEKERDEFLKEYPLSRLASLSAEE